MKIFLPLVLALIGASALAAEVPTLAVGSAAPDFTLPGVDGRDWSLKDFADAKALLIVFTCNHCPTAQAYEERLKKIVEDYTAKGVAVVAISPNDPKSVRLDELSYSDLGDSFDDMKIRAKDRAFNFPYLYDGDTESVSRAYGPAVTPHAFVFDAARKLRYVGRIDDAEREPLVKQQDLREALDAVLAGKELEVTQTKTFGCSMKWAGKEEQVKAYMEKLAKEPVALELVDPAGLAAAAQRRGDEAAARQFLGDVVRAVRDRVSGTRGDRPQYRNRDFEFVSVSANYPDEKPEALKFLTKQQASNRNLIFGSTDKYKLIEAFDKSWSGALPYTVLLDAKGEVLLKTEGPINALEIKRAILKVLGRSMVK